MKRDEGKRFFLNSYHPLCETRKGKNIVAELGLPPYIDASIRREPDFECKYPSISGLCRLDKLVGRTRVGDIIAYITVKRAGVRKLVAILEVIKKFLSHADAAAWYMKEVGSLPSNCMVSGNKPKPSSMAVSNTPCRTHVQWDQEYQLRADQCGTFLACRTELMDLHNPPDVPEDIFSRPFPITRTPSYISESELNRLRNMLSAR
ncbi:MAG: hypothetical protein AMXMBFR7_09560 [Planctomycetota bacterium]